MSSFYRCLFRLYIFCNYLILLHSRDVSKFHLEKNKNDSHVPSVWLVPLYAVQCLKYTNNGFCCSVFLFFCMPPPFKNGRGISYHRSSYVRTYVPNIDFRSLSFEKISLLDSYFIHRYIIIKYRLSSNLSKIYLLLWELWPLFNYIDWLKMVSVHHLLKRV